MNEPEFDQLLRDEPDRAERARLRRTHELLLAAGPPPDLSPALSVPPGTRPPPQVITMPGGFPRRRVAASLVAAAAMLLVVFGGGYLVGREDETFPIDFVLPMNGTDAMPQARASLEVGLRDEAGNWPMRMVVRNLPESLGRGRYELWLTQDGRLVASCGVFSVTGEETVVYLNAPYRLRFFDDWVVTREHSQRILLTTPPGARERAEA